MSAPDAAVDASWVSSLNLSENEQGILRCLMEDNRRTMKEVSDITGYSLRWVKQGVASLKEKGVLIRIGNNKGGYWDIQMSNSAE